MKRKIQSLPANDDKEFWDGQSIKATPKPLNICSSHTKENFMNHVGYKDNKDGTCTCKYCGWGFRLPGYMRVFEERIIDFRDKNKG